MNRTQLLAELRRLFAEEQKVQWRIGDLLCREVGPPGDDSGHNGSLDQIEEIANELGVSIGTLLKYRRMAGTYAPATRVAGASFTAHEAASSAADPHKVMAEAAKAAEREAARTGSKPVVKVGLVREIASKPEHQKPNARLSPRAEARQVPGGEAMEWLAAMELPVAGLKRIVVMLQAVGQDEQLPRKTDRMLTSAMDRCDSLIAWIRAYLAGDAIADEVADFLQKQA